MVKSYNSFLREKKKQKQNKTKKPCSKSTSISMVKLLKFVPLIAMILGVMILSKSLMYPLDSKSTLDPECKESIELSKQMGFGTMLLGLGLLTNYLLYIFQQK